MMRVVAGLMFLVAATAGAQDMKVVKDPNHSEITFIAESRLIDAHGRWDKWDADIMVNPSAWEQSSVKLTIDARSVNTQVAMRDNDLRGPRFFYVDSFPTITFESKIVNKISDTRFNITGDLTIRGITKSVTIPANLVFYDDKTRGGRFRGQFTVLRNDYGVGFNPPGNPIADEVAVSFNVTFRPAAR